MNNNASWGDEKTSLPRIRIRKDFLRRQREIAGIDSEEAQARLLGVDRATLRRIDAGSQPSGYFMAAVADTYGIGLGEAFEVVRDPRAEIAA